MTQGDGKRQLSDKSEVAIDPRAKSALEALVAKEHHKKVRKKLFRRCCFILFVLVMASLIPLFYCSVIIGTNYETILLKQYPRMTEKTVRTAVIIDSWYLKITGPILEALDGKGSLKPRRAVNALGMESTRDGGGDPEKIRNLKETVAASLIKSPKGMAFAVYELPPKKSATAE